MQATISPGSLRGTVAPPASKSMMQRVCAAALLHKGITLIQHPGTSNDDKAAVSIIRQLGARVTEMTDGNLRIDSKGISPLQPIIDCGESGLSARLFTPIAALSNLPITVTGHGSLLQRPMTEIGKILPALGVKLDGFSGHLPIHLKGPLQPQDIRIDGSMSSQYLSGVLFALAFSVKEPVTVSVHNLKSKPYIDLTLQVLKDFGRRIEHQNYERFEILPGSSEETIIQQIECDWSSAAAWIVAGAIAGKISIQNLNQESTQADRQIMEVLEKCGASYKFADGKLQVNQLAVGSSQLANNSRLQGENSVFANCQLQTANYLTAFQFDATDCPDLFPVLSILATACKGKSEIKGLHRLTHKESNRTESICYMLQQLGVDFSIADDKLQITGKEVLNSCTIPSFNDHRIVMAAAIAALRANGKVTITQSEAVAKSYPDFFRDLGALRAKLLITE